jgi:hypothetical protein
MAYPAIQSPPAAQPAAAANFAPLQPLLAIQGGNLKAESTFGRAIRERFEHHYNLERKVRESLISAGYTVSMFIEGKQFLTPNRWAKGLFVPYTPKSIGEREKRSMNITRFYASNSLWKWQLSNPDIVAIAGRDTEQAREAAQAADIIVENHERKFFGATISKQEALSGMCFGTYIWDISYDNSQETITALQPIFGMKQVTLGEGWGQCGSCPYGDVASAFPPVSPDPLSPPITVCPQCGSEAMVDQPATDLLPSVTGVDQVQVGKLVANLLPFPECGWDLRYPIEQSSWMYHMRRTSAAAVRRLFGNIKLPQGGVGSDDFGLSIMDKLTWAAGGGSGTATNEGSRNLFSDPATAIRYSLGPDDIADIILKEDEPTVDGGVIPAGPLLQTFPHGLTVRGLNGLTVIANVEPKTHNYCMKSGTWFDRTLSGAGQGLDDLIEVQKRYNTMDSQVVTFMRATSTPPIRVMKGLIGEQNRGQYLGDASTNVWVDPINLPDGMRMEDAVGPLFQPPSIPAQTLGYIYQTLNNVAQLTSHITDFTGGLPGVKNSTATGAQITQANSNALFTPILQGKGEVRKRIAEITVDLYRTHIPVSLPFPLKGRNGRQQYIYLSGADLDTDISFEVVKDSENPRNTFIKREDVATMFVLLGGAEGYQVLQQTNPELLVEIEKLFNARLSSEAYDQVASLCQQRITQLRQVVQVAPDPTVLTGLMKDPMSGTLIPVGQGVIDPPVALEEPDHQLKYKWLSEWLDTDEGQTAGPVLRGAVILLINFHFQLATVQGSEVAFQAGQVQAAAATPGAIGQALGGAVQNEINPVPDINEVPEPGSPPTAPTGRPKPKGGAK